ncbi:MAG: hypothetical protein RQ715_06660 [Methylococcales bacterium]|nr:hypothetical protein [Methylococcales bacterium]
MPLAVFQQFLKHWHGLPEQILDIPDVLARLEGLPLPAQLWEQAVLPARIQRYRPGMIDTLFMQGQWLWLKLNAKPPSPGKRPTGTHKRTAITLIQRQHLAAWRYGRTPDISDSCLTGPAHKLLAVLCDQGACFRFELQTETGLLAAEMAQGLAELVNLGLISCDSFQGLRNIIGKPRYPDDQGRWFALKSAPDTPTQRFDSALHRAKALLWRYGVVFRTLLDKEPLAPSWRNLLYALRRLEAAGEIHSGRFVQGQAGEQFALPEAARLLAAMPRSAHSQSATTANNTDPEQIPGICLDFTHSAMPKKLGILK